jgi:predicted Zn finger-like uncharacterized protein
MKIQCQSCQAKYTIADEKVLGKVVKIRCKKCGATIVINGNEQPPAEDAAETHVFDYANQSGEQWTVNVADGDQRTMSVAEIVAEYKKGTINDETYCWKDGMPDWLPLRDIESIYNAVKAAGAPEISVSPQTSSASAGAGALFAPPPDESPFAASAQTNGNGALFGKPAEQAAPTAARRAGGRAQGADLFGNVEKAGGEDDVMTSAAASSSGGGGGATGTTEKLTGQRNENSVLFSLAALTEAKKDMPANRTTATSDGSGLIDIRALSANLDAGEKKKDTSTRVDDIMNLSGGGAFGAALAAPILAPPPLESVDLGVTAGAEPSKQNKMLIFAILGAGAFIAIAIIVAVVLTRGGDHDKKDSTTAAASSATAGETTSSGAVASSDTSKPSGATATADKNDETPPPPGTGNATKPAVVNTPPKTAGGGGAVVAKAAANNPTPDPGLPPAPKVPDKPPSLSDAMGEAVGKKPSGSGGGGGSATAATAPFDRGAAAAALGNVNVQSCKKPDGPTGSGHVTVTFAPDGSVTTAVVDGGPFPGTAVGGCVAGKFRGARVPPFSGAPVRVGKSFTIN